MKKVGINGSFILSIPLCDFQVKVDDETFGRLAELQANEEWEEVDEICFHLLQDNFQEMVDLSDDGEYEGDDVVRFYDQEEEK